MTSKFVRINDQASQDALSDARRALEDTRAAVDARDLVEAARSAARVSEAYQDAQDAALRLAAAGASDERVDEVRARAEQAGECWVEAIELVQRAHLWGS